MKRILSIILICVMTASIFPVVSFAASKPSAPSINSFTAVSNSSIKIGWGKVSGATKYRVDRRRSGESDYKTLTKTYTSTSYTDTGLKSGNTYYYRVYAINDAGTSARSTTYQTHTKPDAPTISSVSRDSDTQLTINWNKISGATKYKILYRRGDQSEYKTLVSNVTGTSYTNKGLTANSKYWYKVVAIREGDVGPEGARSKKNIESANSATVGNFTKISRPSTSVDNDNPSNVILKWGKAISGATYAYDIYRKAPNSSGFTKIARTSDTTYTDKGLTSGVVYAYKINTINTDANTSCTWSDEFYAAPKITEALTLTPQSATSMKISWNRPTSATGLTYTIMKWTGDAYTTYDTTSNTYYVDNGLTTGNSYRYYVQVRDTSGNYLTSTYGKSAVLEILPTGVSLNKSSVNIGDGESTSLTAAISPSNSTNQSVTWSSSNTNIATVSPNGVVTAKNKGNAVITVKTSNGKTAACTVNVINCVHSYGEWIIDSYATCTENGHRHRVCNRCQETDGEDIPATGHSLSDEWYIIKEPTCLENGEKAHVCVVCQTQADNIVIEATGHSFYDEWITEKESTCIEEGVEYRSCRLCGEKEYCQIEKSEHQYELINDQAPSGSLAGLRKYKCKVCGNEYEETYWPEKHEGHIEVGSECATTGDTVILPIKIDENPGIASFSFKIYYDQTALTPVAVEEGKYIKYGEILKNGNLNIGQLYVNLNQDKESNPITTSWINTKSISENGILFYLAFKVNGTAPLGDYDITLEYSAGDIVDSVSNCNIMPSVTNGKITVDNYLKGDVNQDGKVDGHDGILLLQHLAYWKNTEFNDAQMLAADLYKDGKITIKDAVYFSQYMMNTSAINTASEVTLCSVAEYETEYESEITVKNCTAQAGEYIDIPVTITDNMGIAGFSFKINYDNKILTPIDVYAGDLLSSEITSNIQQENIDTSELEYVTVCCGNGENSKNDGVLFTIRFAVNSDVGMGSATSIEIGYDEDSVCNIASQSIDDVSTVFNDGVVQIGESSETFGYQYEIENVVMSTTDGIEISEIPQSGDFDLNIEIKCLKNLPSGEKIIAAAYDENGALVALSSQTLNETTLINGICKTHIKATDIPIKKIKVFIWNSVNRMMPLSEFYQIE